MAKMRKKTTPTRRKRTTRVVKKKKTPRKGVPAVQTRMSNSQAYWSAYEDLQRKINKAWDQIQVDVAHKVAPRQIIRDKNNLLLLLGECDYMARECMKMVGR